MIVRSTHLTGAIVGTEETTDSTVSNPQSRKEKRYFWRPDDAEKWCEIHRTMGHDLKGWKTFLDRKKMPPLAALAPQEPR